MRIYLGMNRKKWDGREWVRVAGILREFGYKVMAPTCQFSCSKQELESCDAVAMLDGWEDCFVCREEEELANRIGIQCSGWRDYVDTQKPLGNTTPEHYKFDIEPIDAIEAWGLGFKLGNVIKYVARHARKGDPVGDLKKAAWYLERAIGEMDQ